MEDSKRPTLETSYFNEIKIVDGKAVIQNPDNTMALVNKLFSLPSDYIPEDLVRPNVSFSFGEQELEKSKLRKEAAIALEVVFSEAKKNGLELFAVSGYRSYDRQNQVFTAESQIKGRGTCFTGSSSTGKQ